VVKVRYSSNNSGGDWWLTDDHWLSLEKAGWEVDWVANRPNDGFIMRPSDDGRWLGALAMNASVEGMTMRDAISDWESVTGLRSAELGCSCCGPPHSFTSTTDDGKTDYYSPSYPEYGDEYGGDGW
jgi:hypothetical protein